MGCENHNIKISSKNYIKRINPGAAQNSLREALSLLATNRNFHCGDGWHSEKPNFIINNQLHASCRVRFYSRNMAVSRNFIESQFKNTFANTAAIIQKSPPDAPTSSALGVTTIAEIEPTITPELYKIKMRTDPWMYSSGMPAQIWKKILLIRWPAPTWTNWYV